MNAFFDSVNSILGLGVDPKDLTFVQIGLRGIIVFAVSVAMVRMASKRFMSKMTAFDTILGFILASMLARAVNGSSSFFPTLGGGFVLVWLHRLVGTMACKSHWFGNLVKGHCDAVIQDGVVLEHILRKHNLTEHDLMEDLRLNGNTEEPTKIKAAYLERNGQISMVKQQ